MTRTIEYVYFINGIIPELMANAAYRRTGHTCRDKEKLKIIKCPYCGQRLTDVKVSVKVALYRNPYKTKPNCHGYFKCQNCKDVVGMMMLAS